jgi:peptidoglycan/xylan/chitin deacetylase (PgdA/CDA1 family)
LPESRLMKHILNRTVKWIIAIFIHYTGLLIVLRAIRRKFFGQTNWTIITYHNIVGADEKRRADTQPGMCVLANSFDKQMRYISRNFNIISIERLVAAICEGQDIPANTIAVTFDDGWRDNYTHAFPILKKYKIPAMIFLATDLIKTGKIPPFLEISMLLGKSDIWPAKAVNIFRQIIDKHNLTATIPRLNAGQLQLMARNPYHFMRTLMMLEYKHMHEIIDSMLRELHIDKAEWCDIRWMMNVAEIREMAASGIEFGSHGESHDLMVLIELEQVTRELKQSKEYIEGLLGKKIDILAYPNGDYNDAIKTEVLAAGYLGAMAMYNEETTENIDRLALKRTGFSEGACIGPLGGFSKAIFACKIARVL